MKQELDIDLNSNIIPKKDIIFKKIFATEGNENILKAFLEAVLKIKINTLNLNLNKEDIPDNPDGKVSYLDVKAELSDGTLVNIEMQMSSSIYLEDRVLRQASSMVAKAIKKGEDYQELRNCISIWILNQDYFHENKDYISYWTYKPDKPEIFKSHFGKSKIIFIELNKLRKADIIAPTALEYWLWFIDYTNKERIKMAYKNEKDVKEALEKLRELSSDEYLVDLMDRMDDYERDQRSKKRELVETATAEGLAKGHAEGLAKGHAEAIKEMALKLKKRGLSVKEISEITELSEEEIKNLN